jgi:hypothetical protein
MHDFIRHLSFNSPAPFAAARTAAEPMRCVLRSFNEVPAPTFRPSPQVAPRRKLRARTNRRS